MLTQGELIVRYEGVQSFLTEGCLFLCLCSIAEQVMGQKIDILDTIRYCKRMGYIDSKNEMTEEGQCMYLRDLTGKVWEREEFKNLPAVVPDNMYTVEKWVNPNTGYTHFKRRFVDTLKNSVTVRDGYMIGYYGYIHG